MVGRENAPPVPRRSGGIAGADAAVSGVLIRSGAGEENRLGGSTVVYKPRNKRLPPEKVRANLLAQQERLAKAATLNERFARAATPEDVIKEAQQEVTIRMTKVATDMYTELRYIAEINPAYRPLIGNNWKETFRRVKVYADALPEAQRKEFFSQFKEVIGRSSFDPLEFLGLVLLADHGH